MWCGWTGGGWRGGQNRKMYVGSVPVVLSVIHYIHSISIGLGYILLSIREELLLFVRGCR